MKPKGKAAALGYSMLKAANKEQSPRSKLHPLPRGHVHARGKCGGTT